MNAARCVLLALAFTGFAACDDPVGEFEPDAPGRFAEVSAGDQHTCAVALSGRVWCWGRMDIARLGFASDAAPCDGQLCAAPVPVYGDPTATLVSAGGEHTCAVIDDGAYCWGYGFWGQLGDDRSVYQRCQTEYGVLPQPCSIEPFPVALGFGVIDITAGTNHSCTIADNGTAYCFGLNQFGQTGTGIARDTVPGPEPVVGERDYVSISAGTSHSCAVAENGTAWCWGANEAGTLGTGAVSPPSPTPVQVADPLTPGSGTPSWRTIDLGPVHTCATTWQGPAFCWGLGGGRLGTADGISWAAPVRVEHPDGTRIVEISAGGAHSCVIDEAERLYCFGDNDYGQLGDGSAADQNLPGRVGPSNGWLRVSAGGLHTCAIDTGNRLWCWGNNDWGQLGVGDLGHRPLPARVGD